MAPAVDETRLELLAEDDVHPVAVVLERQELRELEERAERPQEPGVPGLVARAEEVLDPAAVLQRVVDAVEVALRGRRLVNYSPCLPFPVRVLVTRLRRTGQGRCQKQAKTGGGTAYLEILPPGRINYLDELGIAQADYIRSDAHCGPQLLVQAALRLDLGGLVIVHEPPQIREPRPERAGDVPEGRGEVKVQYAGEQEDGGDAEAEKGDARAREGHLGEGGQGLEEGSREIYYVYE